MYYGKGYGRYADDHDTVYNLLPNNLEQVLKKGGITDVKICDYEHNDVEKEIYEIENYHKINY